MTVMKRLSKQRQAKILSQIDVARTALAAGDQGSTLNALDKAMKLFNGWDDSSVGTMRYDQLFDACESFRKQTGFCSLSSLLLYIEHWQREDILLKDTSIENLIAERDRLSAETVRLHKRLAVLEEQA